MTRKVIFVPDDYFTNPPPKENPVTDQTPEPIDPDFANIEMPADTITLTAAGACFILSPSGDGKLIANLALNTNEMGCYRVLIPREVFVSMVDQLVYYRSLTGEQAKAIAHQLHEGPSE